MTPKEMREAEGLFKHRSCIIVFALLYMDGTTHHEVLGITQRLYRDSESAENWYRLRRYDLSLAEPFIDAAMCDKARKVLDQLNLNILTNRR